MTQPQNMNENCRKRQNLNDKICFITLKNLLVATFFNVIKSEVKIITLLEIFVSFVFQ
jgi:hypothetical protein